MADYMQTLQNRIYANIAKFMPYLPLTDKNPLSAFILFSCAAYLSSYILNNKPFKGFYPTLPLESRLRFFSKQYT